MIGRRELFSFRSGRRPRTGVQTPNSTENYQLCGTYVNMPHDSHSVGLPGRVMWPCESSLQPYCGGRISGVSNLMVLLLLRALAAWARLKTLTSARTERASTPSCGPRH